MKPLKILLSAYACSPYKGSEAGVGWNFIKNISGHHIVHVITEEIEFKRDIEKYLAENPGMNKVTFHYIPRKIEYFSRVFPPFFYLFYNNWQKRAFKLALKLEENENFDIIHQLNFVGFREPGYLWKINKPFVWGPVGGMDNTALKLLFNLDLQSFLYYFLRNIMNKLQIMLLLRPKEAANRPNNLLIAATPQTQAYIKKYWNCNSIVMPEVGQEERKIVSLVKRNPGETLQIIWSGQHTSGKALNILLKSLAKLPREIDWSLVVLGDGKKTSSWKRLAKKLNLDHKVTWAGWLPKAIAHEKMMGAHLICITSLKDLTSTVVLEGLSFGLPVVCIDHLGFANVVNDQCGIKIPVLMPDQLTLAFAQAISNLYFNEDLRYKLAQGAASRARDFSWSGKTEHLNQIYNSLLKLT